MKQLSGFTFTRSPTSRSVFNKFRLPFKRSGNVSAMDVRTTFLSAFKACLAAPEPRPPHPINPTRMVSPGDAADDLVPRISGADKAPPSAAAVEVLRKVRREVDCSFCI